MQAKGVAESPALPDGGAYQQKSFRLDSEKFRELIIYIAAQSANDPTFGAIKLNKVMYYADFAAYRQFGQPITGATYLKLSEGPAPRDLLKERRKLIDSGEAKLDMRPYFTGMQHRLVIAEGRNPDLELFRPGELELVDSVIDFFEGKTAREVSDFSHRELGWVLARPREDIPYETAWFSSEPISQEIEEMAVRFAADNE